MVNSNKELDRETPFDVWLDYACDTSSAGNRWVLEGGKENLCGQVEGMGG